MKEALNLALMALEKVVVGWTEAFAEYKYDSDIPSENQFRDEVFAAIAAIKEALAQPEQRAQLLFDVDGEMLTASQIMGVELFNFQQATGCDTAAEFLAQPEQEPVAKAMTAHRAAYFMERFKHEEKLLGPNEQAALDFVISMLEAQPEQKQNLKLMPREATPKMLKAMDECSTEGYDERLYEGHAGSVYMAAWDAFHGQHCYCGDITNLGVIHRDDGPCHYPDHKEPEQEPVAIVDANDEGYWAEILPDRSVKVGQHLYAEAPQRKPLSEAAIEGLAKFVAVDDFNYDFARAIEKAHGIKEKNT